MKSSAELLSLKGRRALITGAASGIGRAIGRRFAEASADLILLDVDAAGLSGTAESLRGFPGRVRLETVDLLQREQFEAFWDRIDDEVPDILVNNAGIYPLIDFLQMKPDEWDRVLRTNLEATVWFCQRFIARRRGMGGIIVNVSSIEAVLPFKDDLVPYGVSKAGIIALTRSLARDYGRQGFRVNAILPGAIRTPGTRSLIIYALRRLRFDLVKSGYLFRNRLALGRWGLPDEVARVALFLASDLSSYVQGALVPVDGGFLSS